MDQDLFYRVSASGIRTKEGGPPFARSTGFGLAPISPPRFLRQAALRLVPPKEYPGRE